MAQTWCDDYNGDGAYELFTYMANPDAVQDEYYNYEDTIGAYYYAGADGVECLFGDVYNEPYDVALCQFDKQALLLTSINGGSSSSYSYAWLVDRDGTLKSFSFQDRTLKYMGGNEFTSFVDDYDACTDFTGHTWKAYYQYWDGEKFCEHGGIEISQNQLLKADGAKKYLDKITDVNGNVRKIFYRDNNIININYVVEDRNENMTLVLNDGIVKELTYEDSDGKKQPVGSYHGIYSGASDPEFATYPDEFPLK
ncbi:MAG: hypothetical protein QM689_11835 [Oscillospiraceae bacterium]